MRGPRPERAHARARRPPAARAGGGGRPSDRAASRLLAGTRFVPGAERIREGWAFRFVADRARSAEAVELYRELGFDVAADPIEPENLADECADCRLLMALEFRMIYTRGPARSRREEGGEA